jgi:hypothetical protein
MFQQRTPVMIAALHNQGFTMLRYCIAIALLIPVAVHAESAQQKIHGCRMKGLTFQMAATYRDGGYSPQYSFDAIHREKYDGIDDAFIKNAVNLVYFDDRYAGIPGAVMSDAITNDCINLPKPWKPAE